MDVEIKKGIAKGTVEIPSSKSYCHRLMIAGMFSKNKVTVENVNLCEDVLATINCLKALGADIITNNNTVYINGFKKTDSIPLLNANESGSTLRFLIPCALVLYDRVKFCMSERLYKRGINLYEQQFQEKDIQIIKDDKNYTIEFIGSLKSGTYILKGNESSQYISGLLLSLPYLDNDSIIKILPPIESKNYIDITLDVLRKSDILFVQKENDIYIKGNQLGNLTKEFVELDYSNAAFFYCYNYLGGDIYIPHCNFKTVQNDYKYQEYFKKLSLRFEEIDLENNIDLGPILFAFSSIKNGGHFINTRRLAIKESNRALAMADELRKMNVNIVVNENDVLILPSVLKSPEEPFESHNDHRIIMSLSLFSYLFDIQINHCEAVRKSFPQYFDCLESCGIEVKYVL